MKKVTLLSFTLILCLGVIVQVWAQSDQTTDMSSKTTSQILIASGSILSTNPDSSLQPSQVPAQESSVSNQTPNSIVSSEPTQNIVLPTDPVTGATVSVIESGTIDTGTIQNTAIVSTGTIQNTAIVSTGTNTTGSDMTGINILPSTPTIGDTTGTVGSGDQVVVQPNSDHETTVDNLIFLNPKIGSESINGQFVKKTQIEDLSPEAQEFVANILGK